MRTAPVALLTTLLLTACAGQLPADTGAPTPEGVAADGTQRVTLLVANETRFAPSRVVVKAGKPLALTLRSIGQAPHDFTLTDGVGAPVRIGIDGGGSGTTTFTLDRPGTYRFICSVPGHLEGGMQGAIVAE